VGVLVAGGYTLPFPSDWFRFPASYFLVAKSNQPAFALLSFGEVRTTGGKVKPTATFACAGGVLGFKLSPGPPALGTRERRCS
jgi:hypothetical protein